jgi:hypothetical protein
VVVTMVVHRVSSACDVQLKLTASNVPGTSGTQS